MNFGEICNSRVHATLLLCPCQAFSRFRNEFDFWKVHGIMKTSGLLQSKGFGFMLTLQETQSDSLSVSVC